MGHQLSKMPHQKKNKHPKERIPHNTQDEPGDALNLVCAACRAGPFSYDGFRKAIDRFHYAETGYCYTISWREISESVKNESCHWCALILRTKDGLPAEKFPRNDESVEIRMQVMIQPPVDWTEVTNSIKLLLNGYEAATYSIYADEGTAAAQEIGVGNSLRNKNGYVDYPKVQECIKACSGHEHCSNMEATPLPTRVIDCSDPAKPRLVETQRQIKEHYCTLSYVWGGEQPQKLTTSNIGTYLREGFNAPLPRTIEDAILATHKLGLRYLWVDALCIIQDSVDDKVRELADMGHIYQDAHLTLSVLSSYRADEGFLPDERDPGALPFFVARKGAVSDRMWLRYSIPHRMRGVHARYQTVPIHSPLNERGWCLQESILSPRKLTFQPPTVEYKCRTFAEDISIPLWDTESRRQAYAHGDHVLFPDRDTHDGAVGEEEMHEHWWQIVSQYTNCKITVPSDKLVALASIAEQFQSIIKDDYLAGLWRRTLLDDLLWSPFGPVGEDEFLPPRPQAYRAPTWSWASVDGWVQRHSKHMFEAPSMDYEAELLGCAVTPKNAGHPFGEVADATLTLRAQVRPLMLDGAPCVFKERKGLTHKDQFQTYSASGDWLPPLGNCLQSRSFSGDAQGSGDNDDDEEKEKRLGVRFDCLEGTAQDRASNFHVVILRSGPTWGEKGGAGYREKGWMRGLLVIPVDEECGMRCRRVAKLEVWDFYGLDWFGSASLKTITLV